MRLGQSSHPRDRFITLYGRKPVLEALLDPALPIEKLVIAHNAKGELIADIIAAASQRNLKIHRRPPREVSRISKNGRQDQGVVIDVEAPHMAPLRVWLSDAPIEGQLFLLDGVTTPANVGMIIRAVTGAGALGVIIPRRGCPEVGPLVIKGSAGVALKSTILKCETAQEAAHALRESGWTLGGLRAHNATDLYAAEPSERIVWVLGNEATGISAEVGALIDEWYEIPMSNDVESLNVATAAAITAFEYRRTYQSKTEPMGA